MSDGENPVLSYFATSHDSSSWLGGSPEETTQDDPFAQLPQATISSGGEYNADVFASAQSGFEVDVGFGGGVAQMRISSGGADSDVFASAQSGFEVGFGGDGSFGGDGGEDFGAPGLSMVELSSSEPNPFLQSPLEHAAEQASSAQASGIDAYFGNAADNWLGDSGGDNSWLSGPEQQQHHSPPASAQQLPPPLRAGQQSSPVAKPTLYAVPSVKAVTGAALQPRFQPPPLTSAKPDGFVSPSKFFPPSTAHSQPTAAYAAPLRLPGSDDGVLAKNFPEGRCCGATWAWGGNLFVFSADRGFPTTHMVAMHSCGKRRAFEPSVARIKAWPGCDSSPDAMVKFLGDVKSLKIDDQAVEMAPPFQDSFETLCSLLQLLLTRGSAAASQQYLNETLDIFEDSNSFSDSMNLVSSLDAFRPADPTRDLAQVQHFLLRGECSDAITHAMQSDLWAEAIILSQVTSDPSRVRAVARSLTERCLIAGTPLWFLHALNSGIVPAGPELHSHWRLCAKILVQNRFSNSVDGLRALARAVLSHGDSCAWIALNATAAVFSKEKEAAANFCTPPAADIADLRNASAALTAVSAIKARDPSTWTDEDRTLVAKEKSISLKFEELKQRAPSKEQQQGLFYGFPSEPSPALVHPTTCERAEMLACAFAGKAKGHTVRGLLYWRFMHGMWMADHGLNTEAIVAFRSVISRGHEVDYYNGKFLAECAKQAVLRCERGSANSASASGGSSLFSGFGSFVDSTVKFLVTGSDAPAAPSKAAGPVPDSTPAPAPQQRSAATSTGPKVVFFNPHAGRSQISQQLHQQPTAASAVGDHEIAATSSAAPAAAEPPASPPVSSKSPKLDRSSSDPGKLDASKGASPPPGDKQKGKGGWGIGSFIGGIVSKVLPTGKGVEVDLGEENTLYYNEKLKRYVERGKEDEAESSAFVAPPPIMAAWSEQPSAAPTISAASLQPGLPAETLTAAGGVAVPASQAPAAFSSSSGPPMPTAAARPAAPPSSSALKTSRYAVAGVALVAPNSSAAAAVSSPTPAVRPKPQYKVFTPVAAAAEETPSNGEPS